MIYWTLFWTFAKVGLFTIGGGYAMIPLIQQELVDRHGWVSLEQFTDFVGIAESTPGPFAINIATFAGIHAAQTEGADPILGSVCSTGGVVLPSVAIILLIAGAFHYAMRHWAVRAALEGAKPVVVGLIGAAAFTLLSHTLMPGGGAGFQGLAAARAPAPFLLTQWVRLGAVALILLGAALGLGLRCFGIAL